MISHIFTEKVARRAVEFTLPSVQQLIGANILKRGDLHIVIAQPLVPDNVKESFWYETGILYEHSLGDPKTWECDFKAIARSKCYLSWRYQMPTQMLQTRAPHLLNHDSTVYHGSAVSDGLVVACSGVQAYFDQMVSGWVLEACRALCIQGREALGEGCDGFVC